MGLKTVVNREILEVMDNEGLSLGMLLFIEREIRLASLEFECIMLCTNPLDPDLGVIRETMENSRGLNVHRKYVNERLKMYLN
jgi:hypothetical protein